MPMTDSQPYIVVTGFEAEPFAKEVSSRLAEGYELHGPMYYVVDRDHINVWEHYRQAMCLPRQGGEG